MGDDRTGHYAARPDGRRADRHRRAARDGAAALTYHRVAERTSVLSHGDDELPDAGAAR